MRLGNLALAVDQHRDGRILDGIELFDVLVPDDNRVVNLPLSQERSHRFPAIVVHGNTDNRKSLAPVLVLKLHEPGNLGLAAVAPRSPEVYEHDFSTKVR